VVGQAVEEAGICDEAAVSGFQIRNFKFEI